MIVHLVPAIPRFILLKGFARRYRRRATRRWGPTVMQTATSLSAKP
jgi:hypothetical protein